MLCLGFLLEVELMTRRLDELLPELPRLQAAARAAEVARLAYALEIELDEIVTQVVARFARG